MPRKGDLTVTTKHEATDESLNRPRNHLVTDATKPFDFVFKQYGKPASIIVRQTPEEETWPGGALWDIGVLLSHVLVGLAGFESPGCAKVPARLQSAFYASSSPISLHDLSLLELGCGVGLTGIVAAAVLGTRITILTDLKVVVDKVAEPNMIQNTTIAPRSTHKPAHRITTVGKRGRILAMPLCWGVEQDESAVQAALQAFASSVAKARPPKNRKGNHSSAQDSRDLNQPDVIVIGDVAYQHKPGAPSHFDDLLSTVLKFLGPQTLVIFGTRLRMPCSQDLLELFSSHMEEIVVPPIRADEIDPSFAKFKHQITIHVFRKR
jgi:predicted nicotinamide N-methyase